MTGKIIQHMNSISKHFQYFRRSIEYKVFIDQMILNGHKEL